MPINRRKKMILELMFAGATLVDTPTPEAPFRATQQVAEAKSMKREPRAIVVYVKQASGGVRTAQGTVALLPDGMRDIRFIGTFTPTEASQLGAALSGNGCSAYVESRKNGIAVFQSCR